MTPSDETADIAAEQDPREVQRGMAILGQAMIHKKHIENEKALKGLYVDYLFKNLNLTRYR